MNKGELTRRFGKTEEDRLLLARVLDRLEQAERRSIPAYTHFLSPGEGVLVAELLAACGHPPHRFFGGYEGAERQVCGFAPSWMEPEDLFSGGEPLAALRITFHESTGLGHRDFLGSILGLGLTREKLGDLQVGKNTCDVLLLAETAPIVEGQLTQVGRYPVKCVPLPLEELIAVTPEVKVIRDTVATMRLDAVAASGFSLSRSKAAALVESGRVFVNHREMTKPDRTVSEGDHISCKGLGKMTVKEVSGLSKKGRIMVVLERYI